MSSRATLLVILIIIILIGIVVFQQFRITNLVSAIDNIQILDFQGDSLIVFHPYDLAEKQIFISPEFVDYFTHYKSPFWDGKQGEDRTLQSLINEYVRNRNQDHYGSKRGGREIERIHEGIDLFVAENTAVYPLSDYGVVVEVSDNPNHLEWVDCINEEGNKDSIQVEYGKLVKVLYPEGITSTYVHLNEVYVDLGQEVHGNTKVGLTGRTGNIARSSKPSHLHLEIRYLDGSSFDPRQRLHYRGTSFNSFVKLLNL